ncbi:MAG: GNAT family N-acetyltransferase [Pyrinomonadaceae bacterium]|nr:GNAT family N-acetyltransferase [Phycisphaerales bacterium]
MIQFTTPRLCVRMFRQDDAAALAEYRSDPEVARYVPWGPPYSIEKASDMIGRMAGRDFYNCGDTGLNMAVERHSDHQLIGEAMIKHDHGDPRQGIIGYALARKFHGRGFGAELTRGLIDRFFAAEESHRATAYCDARNIASIRVLEKVGMRLEAEFRRGVFAKGEWVDERVYALLREEWTGARR